MKKAKFTLDRNNLIELTQMGYEVHEFTRYHFRVWKDRDEKYLDFFPTTKMYCYYEDGEYWGKGRYDDLISLVEDKLDDFAKSVKNDKEENEKSFEYRGYFIDIFYSELNQGFVYSIFKSRKDSENDIPDIDGGLCTTTIENAVDMAKKQVEELVVRGT